MTPSTGRTIRALVVDDERLARRKICEWLKAETDFEIVGDCSDALDALEVLAENPVDLIFLDIQMPVMDGFAMLRRISEHEMPLIVFVTAYDQHAIEAFRVHALDYLLKPFDRERFALSVARARQRLSPASTVELRSQIATMLAALTQQTQHLDRFVIKQQGRITFVKVEEVDWLEACGNYVKLHTQDDELLVRDTISRLEGALDPKVFARIHRSTIVNLNTIKELYPASHGDYFVSLKNGERLLLSRTYRKKLGNKSNLKF